MGDTITKEHWLRRSDVVG